MGFPPCLSRSRRQLPDAPGSIAGPSPGTPLGQGPDLPPAPPAGGEVGLGEVKVALILPLSAAGNAGLAAQSMRNAAELALAEFSNPNIQLLIKDDAGNPTTARQVATQAMDEGAEIIIGSLFAHTVRAVGSVARPRNIPVIAFSTDASIAARGVYLLSFLPESDVVRVIGYAFSTGKRSFAGLIPDNAYGSVVEASFREDVARRGGRVVALERYSSEKGKQAEAIRLVAQAARGADAIFIPDGPDAAPGVVLALTNAGVTKRTQLIGTGLWDDQRVFQDAGMQGGLYAAPDPAGYASFVAALSREIRTGSGAHRDAVLRRDRAGRSPGAHAGTAAFLGRGAHQSFGLCRDRRHFPFQGGRHQRARARGDARHAIGRADRQSVAAIVRRVGDLIRVVRSRAKRCHFAG